ncbi:MAG: CocE/NonD family hydrolase [Rhizobiaceae bacterium]|nr:CocE/NonD family hydrolase [Hyphomicrobiales bacterium]NRB28977.1 CocE/NonD family hydrolase [Rhizobiaceae bacterium]
MKVRTEFPREVVEHADWGIEMPDGCRLSARVWMPADAVQNPVPVILEHLPYRKRDGTIVRDQFTHPWMAGHGYACIRTDMRGSGESDGLLEDEYLEQELQDACDVIAWAAAQPWCNGNVGMMGISWGGFNGLQVAARRPEALKAVITICSTVDRFADDIHYKGGCLLLEHFGWSSTMLSYMSRPPDPALVGDKWQDMWLHRLNHQPWHLSEWLRHQHRDAFWKHGSVCEDYSTIQAAVLSIGGWHDGYRNTISHLVENLDAPVKGIVGPWNHKYPHYAGPQPTIGFLQEAKRWWDRWLKGEATGVEDDPAYRAYVMDSLPPKRWYDSRPGRWIADQEWPPQAAQAYHLMPGDTLGDKASMLDVTVCSPPDCGLQSGEYFPFAYSDELPADQRPDDEKSACFDTDVFTEAVDIVGGPQIKLALRSDQPQAQLVVRLCDIRPNGEVSLITFGCLNLCHRESHEFPSALIPGESFEVTLNLDQCAYHLPAGHRLRVAISNAYWPFIWPSPSATAEPACLTLGSGQVSLPMRPHSDATEWTFEEPEGAAPWNCENLRAAQYLRTFETQDDGTIVMNVHSDAGENRDLEHGLISGTQLSEQFFIHPQDPLSARCTSRWEQVGGRDGQMWRTEAEAELTSDANQFHTTAHLRAYLNDELVFDRHFDDHIDRNLL